MRLLGKLRNTLVRVSKRYAFRTIQKTCGLSLSYRLNRQDVSVLRAVFTGRCYSDYFPFYQRATVVDIGAHKGYFAIFAALNTRPESRVIALEPSAANFRALLKNIESQGIAKIEPLNAGVYSETASLDLHMSTSVNHSIFGKEINPLSSSAPDRVEKVDVLSLKDLMAQQDVDRIDFLKMDCEGAEYPALLACDESTLSRVRTISLEFHDLKDPQYNGGILVEYLSSNGFEVVKYCYEATWRDLNYGKIVATRARVRRRGTATI